MGGTSSKINIDNQSFNESIMNYMNENQTKSGTDAITYQDINIKNSHFICTLVNQQTSNVQVKTIQQFNNDSTANLITDIMNNIEDQVKNKLDEESGFLSTPEGKEQKTNVTNTVKNLLEENFTTKNLNELVSKVNIGQTIEMDGVVVDPCGLMTPGLSDNVLNHLIDNCPTPKPDCPNQQDIFVAMFSQQVGNNVVKLLSENKDVQDFVNKVDQETKVKTTGIFQDIGNALKKIFGSIWLPFIIAAVIVLVALIFWFIKSGEKPTNVAKVAATVAVPEAAVAQI